MRLVLRGFPTPDRGLRVRCASLTLLRDRHYEALCPSVCLSRTDDVIAPDPAGRHRGTRRRAGGGVEPRDARRREPDRRIASRTEAAYSSRSEERRVGKEGRSRWLPY